MTDERLEPPNLIVVLGLLFLAVTMHRLLYYGAKAEFVVAWLDPERSGGVGFSRPNALALYDQLGALLGWAPLIGGLAALVLGRATLPVGGLAFLASGCIFLLNSPASMTGLALFSLGHGLVITSVYSSAGSERFRHRSLRVGFFLLLYLGINVGSVLGPWLTFAANRVAGHRVVFALFTAAATTLAAIGFLIARMRRTSPTVAMRSTGRSVPVGCAIVLAAWYWLLFSAGLSFLTPSHHRWEAAGYELSWFQAIPPTLLVFLALLFSILCLVAGDAGYRIPSASAMLALATAVSGVSTLLLYPITTATAPPVAMMLLREALNACGELALVVVIAAVASGFGVRYGALAIGCFLTLILHPKVQALGHAYGALFSGETILATTLVSLGLAVATWVFRDKLRGLEADLT